jgi:hypothetical protein
MLLLHSISDAEQFAGSCDLDYPTVRYPASCSAQQKELLNTVEPLPGSAIILQTQRGYFLAGPRANAKST